MLPKAPALWWVGKMLGCLGPARTELIAKAFLALAERVTPAKPDNEAETSALIYA